MMYDICDVSSSIRRRMLKSLKGCFTDPRVNDGQEELMKSLEASELELQLSEKRHSSLEAQHCNHGCRAPNPSLRSCLG